MLYCLQMRREECWMFPCRPVIDCNDNTFCTSLNVNKIMSDSDNPYALLCLLWFLKQKLSLRRIKNRRCSCRL